LITPVPMFPCGVKGCSAYIKQTKIFGWGGSSILKDTRCELCGKPACREHIYKSDCLGKTACVDCLTKAKMYACVSGLATLSFGCSYFS